jgi:hypothetical protein
MLDGRQHMKPMLGNRQEDSDDDEADGVGEADAPEHDRR